MIYVYTALVNGHDNLRVPLCPTAGARWICYTNNPLQPPCPPWEFRPVYDVGHPARTARVPKILPHLLLPDDAEYSIWQDANFQLLKPPAQIVNETLERHDWAVHEHPKGYSLCAYGEGRHCIKQGIGTAALIEAELDRYKRLGYPEQNGLYANGFIVRRHSDATKRLCERWWQLFSEGSERDQISFPVARWLERLPIFVIEQNIWTSSYVHYNFHAAWPHRDNNVAYTPQRDKMRETLIRLRDLTKTCGGIQFPEV